MSDLVQMYLPGISASPPSPSVDKDSTNGQANKLQDEDHPIHDWYRFVLSFPAHLVRDYIDDFGLEKGSVVLDPFCGTGTTLVEAKLNGYRALGLETNPFPHFASVVKTNWDIDPSTLLERAREIGDATLDALRSQGIDDQRPFAGSIENIPLGKLEPSAMKLLIKDSISPLPLHKVCVLLDHLKQHSGEPYYGHALLALGYALVNEIGNLRFGPEVGVGKVKPDAPVVSSWLSEVEKISSDLGTVVGEEYPDCRVYLADSRQISQILGSGSVDGVITSPPYPNEKDYTRTTRLESVVLGFINNGAELRASKKTFLRSNTRGVYKGDDDDTWIAEHEEIQRIADAIEQRRVELGKTSGFERLYARVTRLYFGGMARHLAELRTVLRPGAYLGYVVGDQASYLRIMIRTGRLLADIAQRLGYEHVRTDLFRTRFATATKKEMREEVVVLRWPGEA